MTSDKLKQIVALVGGALGALYLFLQTLPEQYHFSFINPTTVDAFIVLLNSLVPLVMIAYGIWKNQYFSKKAQVQEQVLKSRGLK